MDRALLTVIALFAAYLLDYLFGDPRSLPHPVRLLGVVIDSLDKAARRVFSSPLGLKTGGFLIVAILAVAVVGLTLLLLTVAYRLHPVCGVLMETYIFFVTLAGGDLRHHVQSVEKNLHRSDLKEARTSVALLVSRDTSALDENGVSRAALESLFENSADGLVAPLLFAAVFGPAGAVLYKTVNTLDSMLGYKTEEYLNLGFFAAITDDILNYIPARLTAVFIILAGASRSRWQNGWQALVADRHKHDSPNSAWPEAAAAGVLGIRFGGADNYRGAIIKRPLINAAGKEPVGADIGQGLALFRNTSVLAFISLIFISYYLRTWEALPF